MPEALTQPMERRPTIPGLAAQATRLAPAPDRRGHGCQRSGRQPVDDASPAGGRGGPPAPPITRCPAPVARRAADPPAPHATPEPRSLRLPGGTLDSRPHCRRDAVDIGSRVSSAPCRSLVPGHAVVSTPARQRDEAAMARWREETWPALKKGRKPRGKLSSSSTTPAAIPGRVSSARMRRGARRPSCEHGGPASIF